MAHAANVVLLLTRAVLAAMEMEDMSLEVAEKDTAAEIAAEAAVADPANRPAKRSSNTRVRLSHNTTAQRISAL